MKIAIIGFSGSGKSTLAKKIALRFSLPVLHLDTIHFTEAWQKRNPEEARNMEKSFRKQTSWIIEGNYQRLENEDRFADADQIIFLDFNRFLCFRQAFSRFLSHRGRQRDDLAKGSYDRLNLSFVWWILWEGRRKKWTSFYARIGKTYPHKFIVLKNHRAIENYLADLKN